MNPTISTFVSLLFLTFCLALQARLITSTQPEIPHVGPVLLAPLITKACSISPNKEFCKTVLNSEPDTTVKGLSDLVFIALNSASNTAARNVEFISESVAALDASDEPSDATLMQIFTDCEGQYEGAVDEIDNAISALTLSPHDDHIDTLVKDSTTAIETCQKSAKGQSGKGLDLYHRNEALLKLLENAADVLHVFKTELEV